MTESQNVKTKVNLNTWIQLRIYYLNTVGNFSAIRIETLRVITKCYVEARWGGINSYDEIMMHFIQKDMKVILIRFDNEGDRD